MDELSRVRRQLTRAQVDLADLVIGWLIVELMRLDRIDRTEAERETLRQLEILRVRLRTRD